MMLVDQNTWDHDRPGSCEAGNHRLYTRLVTRIRATLLFQSHNMSSISFPNASHYSMSSVHSNAEDEDNPYRSTFDTTPGIQMNPHSPHPPRTPRTSTVYSGGFDPSLPSPKHTSGTLDLEPEEERVHDHPAKTRVKNEEVWREIVKSSDGRDKAFVRRVFFPPRTLV